MRHDTRDPDPASRAQKFKQISEVTFKLSVGLVIVGMAISILVLVVRQNSNTHKTDTTLENTQDVKRALHILIDCTTPKHTCYDRGSKATADAVATLNRVTILASACAATLPRPTPANVKHCVLAHLH